MFYYGSTGLFYTPFLYLGDSVRYHVQNRKGCRSLKNIRNAERQRINIIRKVQRITNPSNDYKKCKFVLVIDENTQSQ